MSLNSAADAAGRMRHERPPRRVCQYSTVVYADDIATPMRLPLRQPSSASCGRIPALRRTSRGYFAVQVLYAERALPRRLEEGLVSLCHYGRKPVTRSQVTAHRRDGRGSGWDMHGTQVTNGSRIERHA